MERKKTFNNIIAKSLLFMIIMFVNVSEVKADSLDLYLDDNIVIEADTKERHTLENLGETIISEEDKLEELLQKLCLNLTDKQTKVLDSILNNEDEIAQLFYEAILNQEGKQLDLAIDKYNEILSNTEISKEVTELIELFKSLAVTDHKFAEYNYEENYFINEDIEGLQEINKKNTDEVTHLTKDEGKNTESETVDNLEKNVYTIETKDISIQNTHLTADDLYDLSINSYYVSDRWKHAQSLKSNFPSDGRVSEALDRAGQGILRQGMSNHRKGNFDTAIYYYNLLISESKLSSTIKNDASIYRERAENGQGISTTIIYTDYNYSIEEMVAKQANNSPRTDGYSKKIAYVSSEYINRNGNIGTVNTTNDNLRVRFEPNTKSEVKGSLGPGATVTILGEEQDTNPNSNRIWYAIEYDHGETWQFARRNEIKNMVDPNNFTLDENHRDMYQFLILSETSGISVSDLNNALRGKGILEGRGQAFITAGKQHNLNELYLVSHAFLETGNGTSTLAKGVLVKEVDGRAVEPRIVYNVFGIGAYDSSAIKSGSERAYKEGWFTPEAAIIGGAKFIGQNYINHSSYKQDTLYKMRWNPENPGIHQYATDIGWAVKQTRIMDVVMDLCAQANSVVLKFDIPRYKSK